MVGCLLSVRADDLPTYLCSVFVHMLRIHYCKWSQKPIICSWLCPLWIRLINRTWNSFLPQDPRLLRRVGLRSSFTEPWYDGGWWRQDRNRSERPLVPPPQPTTPSSLCPSARSRSSLCKVFSYSQNAGWHEPTQHPLFLFPCLTAFSPPFHAVSVLSSLYSHLFGSGLK